jgi:mycothiol synthase
MVWPVQRQVPQFLSQHPHGYILRTYQPGDESGFFQLMALAGWPDWDAERLKPWLYRILPRGWFMAVDQESDEIMATSMATHDPTWQVPFCAELGWVAAHPAHTGNGLGTLVVAAALTRMLEAGYEVIHLFTEEWRFAALKIYLRLGLIPIVDSEHSLQHWQVICNQLNWPFIPDSWGKEGWSFTSQFK